MPFEELHRAFMFLGGSAVFERAQVSPLAGFRILLSRI
jgi:hypothetical protein